MISGTIGLWSNTIKEGIHPGKETGAGNGASDLFLAMYVAPPGVYLEEVQLPFSPRTKWAEDCVVVCQQEACSLHISSSFFPACLTTSFEASDTDKSGLEIFLEVEFCFCLLCFTYFHLLNSVVSAPVCGPCLLCGLPFLCCTSSLSHISLVFFVTLLPFYTGPW